MVLFTFQRRTTPVERIIKFASVFACLYDPKPSPTAAMNFLENFLKFLLVPAIAADKVARSRACQVVYEEYVGYRPALSSDIIMRLPDDAEVSKDSGIR
ncbi:hypothetical protein OROGR_017918 [Orobanche gracilis]